MRIQIEDHDADKYITKLPDDADVIGKITRTGPRPIGALVLLDTWEFIQISDGVQMHLDQKPVYTAIIKAILSDFCEEHVDLALKGGFSLHTIQSWSSGRRAPAFGTIKLLLLAYGIIKR